MLCIPLDNRSEGTESKNCLRYPLTNLSGYGYIAEKENINRKNEMSTVPV